GLLAAWAVAMWMPRSARRILGWAIAIALVGGLAWWSNLWQKFSNQGNAWLDTFMAQIAVLRSAMLPSTWTSRGIQNALQSQPRDAIFYLYVTVAHAIFLSWLGIVVVGRYLQPAYGRAASRSGRPVGVSGSRTLAAVTHNILFYLSRPVRMLVLKD